MEIGKKKIVYMEIVRKLYIYENLNEKSYTCMKKMF